MRSSTSAGSSVVGVGAGRQAEFQISRRPIAKRRRDLGVVVAHHAIGEPHQAMGRARGEAGKQPRQIGGDGGARAKPRDFVVEECDDNRSRARGRRARAYQSARSIGAIGGRRRLQAIGVAIPCEIFAEPLVRPAEPMHARRGSSADGWRDRMGNSALNARPSASKPFERASPSAARRCSDWRAKPMRRLRCRIAARKRAAMTGQVPCELEVRALRARILSGRAERRRQRSGYGDFFISSSPRRWSRQAKATENGLFRRLSRLPAGKRTRNQGIVEHRSVNA